jgi:N-acetyl sugar amidotransferase
MQEIKFCKNCLYSTSHPLGLILNSENICSGCLVHYEKDLINWNERWIKLKNIIKPYRSITSKVYDCIVPISGGQDSYFVMHLVKKLGLNPLVVCYNKYFNTSVGIDNIAYLRIKFNCDVLFQNVNPLSVKKITRNTLTKFGSIYWHILAGHSVFPVQIAAKYKIPLIIWGAHQGLEQVGMYSHYHEVEMTRRYRKDHDLMGFEAEDLASVFDNINEEDIFQYIYPDDFTINQIGIRGIYLGNYVRWDPKAQHELMIKNYKYKTYKFLRTIDCYDYVDCFNYMNLHDLIKIYKHGYSKITDHLSREIRFNRIDRNTALKLCRAYEGKSIKFKNVFCNWLGIDEKSLDFILNFFRNKKFWNEVDVNKWTFNGLSKNNKISFYKKKKNNLHFYSNSKLKNNSSYITFGKGI